MGLPILQRTRLPEEPRARLAERERGDGTPRSIGAVRPYVIEAAQPSFRSARTIEAAGRGRGPRMQAATTTHASTARVGIFDSGVGGLTVAAALHRLAPALSLRYIADTAYFPYGERSEEEIEGRTLALGLRLIKDGCNLLVVACNSASSAALDALRAAVSVPVVGMEPPLKPAAERTRSGRVLVLATPATARGERLQRLHRDHGGNAVIETLPMPGLADLVESGEIDGTRIEEMLGDALRTPLADGVDEIALGCTHYGYLRPALERLVPAGVELIDAAEPVARRVLHQLRAHALEVPAGGEQPLLCTSTGDVLDFASTLSRLRHAGATLPPLVFVSPDPGVDALSSSEA